MDKDTFPSVLKAGDHEKSKGELLGPCREPRGHTGTDVQRVRNQEGWVGEGEERVEDRRRGDLLRDVTEDLAHQQEQKLLEVCLVRCI